MIRFGVDRSDLVRFLENRATEVIGGPDTILGIVALLYDRQVDRIKTGFLPTELDKKFISEERKGSLSGAFSPTKEEEAKILLQVLRHSLLFHQHHLEGIEYVIRASSVDGGFLSSLKQGDTGLRRSFSIQNHTAFRNLRGRSLVFRSLV